MSKYDEYLKEKREALERTPLSDDERNALSLLISKEEGSSDELGVNEEICDSLFNKGILMFRIEARNGNEEDLYRIYSIDSELLDVLKEMLD
ncbi:MAG: hypothetical protein JW779_14200 [Candidatus Thorarchaeota archaeon]|nr:hypothetical protein [Candidatus Thorarchaeota archaeon]